LEACVRFLLVALLWTATVAWPQDATDAVKNAETTGAALFSAIHRNELAGAQHIRNFAALSHALDAQKCPGTSFSFVLLPDRQHASEVYAVSGLAARGKMVIGKHFKTAMVAGAANLDTLVASSKSCLVLTVSPHAAAPFTTELLSPTPTEFHVLETRLHNTTLYVGAGGQAWSVKEGIISKLDKSGAN
jgi:hypothetical protein